VGLVALAGEVLGGHPALVLAIVFALGRNVSPPSAIIAVDDTVKDNSVGRLKSRDLVPVQRRPIPDVQAIALDKAPGLVSIPTVPSRHDGVGCGSPQQEDGSTSDSIFYIVHGIPRHKVSILVQDRTLEGA
jgi:hypothetical protein